MYSFDMLCRQIDIPGFNDGAHRIFFNVTGDLSLLPQSTQNTLKYIRTGITRDTPTKLIDSEVENARLCDEWSEYYMLTLTHDQDIYNDGYDEGRSSGYNEGATNSIISLYQDGLITKPIAIDRLKVDEASFDLLISNSI